MGRDCLCAVRNLNVGQLLCVIKYHVGDLFDTLGEGELGERATVLECALADLFHALRKSDLAKSCIVIECRLADSAESLNRHKTGQRGTTVEGVITDAVYVRGDGDSGELCALITCIVANFDYRAERQGVDILGILVDLTGSDAEICRLYQNSVIITVRGVVIRVVVYLKARLAEEEGITYVLVG